MLMMTELEKMIAQLCTNGVEYRQLNAVAHYSKMRIDFLQVNKDTYVGVENLLQNKQGKIAATSFPKSGTVIAFEKGDILIGNIRPYLRKIWLADCNGGTNGDVLAIQINDRSTLSPKFLYYVLSSEDFFLYDIQNSKGAKMPRGNKDAVMNYFVPVPPLPVQDEIVRILDTFTELTAELTARKKQYRYYRNKLLTFEDDISVEALGDVCDVTAGGTPSKKNGEYWAAGTIKWLGSTVCKNQKTVDEVTDYITEKGLAESSAKLMKEGTTLIALVGATIGKVAFLPFEATINQNIAGIYPKDTKILNPSYVYYACTTLYPKFLALTQGTKLSMAKWHLSVLCRYPFRPLIFKMKLSMYWITSMHSVLT